MNLLANLNLDTNTYVLFGLGITLFSYTTYCFITKSIPLGYKTLYLYENNLSTVTSSDSNESITTSLETIKQNVIENSQIQDIDAIDKIIGLLKAEGPNLYHLSDEALKDRILNILHGLCSSEDSLSDIPTITKSVFNKIREQDPGTRDFLGNIHNWVETLPNSSSDTTNNTLFLNLDEQIEKLSLAIKDVKSMMDTNELLIFFTKENNDFMIKIYNLINQSNHLIDYTTLCNIMTSSSLPLINSNLQVYADLITNMLI